MGILTVSGPPSGPDAEIRHQRGIAENFANQLAQMAVGVEATFLGSALKDEPEVGVVELDARSSSATVNGRPTDLALASYLHAWVVAELERKGLDPSWLKKATIRVDYSRTFVRAKRRDWADFVANALVVSQAGEARATFANNQRLVRGIVTSRQRRMSGIRRLVPLTVAAAAASVAFLTTTIWVLSGFWVGLPFAILFGLGAGFAAFALRSADNRLPAVSLGVLLLGELEPLGGLVASGVLRQAPSLGVVAPLAAGAIAVMALVYAIRRPTSALD